MTDLANQSEEFKKGFFTGYTKGENERVWLATANSDLRSDILELSRLADSYREYIRVTDQYFDRNGWPNQELATARFCVSLDEQDV